mgnify:CR=1 FL=1
MKEKKNKKTEPDVKNNDRQKEKKSVKLGSMAPALSAILVVACAGASVAAYTPKVYAVQKAAPKATESDTVEDTTAEEMNLEVRYLICRMVSMKEQVPDLQERSQ